MPDIKIKCPYCQEGLDAPQEMFGQVAECPACEKSFKIPIPQQVHQHEMGANKPPKKHIIINRPPQTSLLATVKEYKGVGRGGYWLLSFGSWILFSGIVWGMFGANLLTPQINPSFNLPQMVVFLYGLLILMFVFNSWLHVSRMCNMGYSGGYGLLIYLPVANMGVALMCLCFPTGYRDAHKLDTTAWVLISICLLSFLFQLIAVVLAVILNVQS